MIGPFSTTLIPLSSSWSVDRQVLINVEASAISRDERKFGFIFTKIPVPKAFGWRKKGAWTRSSVISVCLRPPQSKTLRSLSLHSNSPFPLSRKSAVICRRSAINYRNKPYCRKAHVSAIRSKFNSFDGANGWRVMGTWIHICMLCRCRHSRFRTVNKDNVYFKMCFNVYGDVSSRTSVAVQFS